MKGYKEHFKEWWSENDYLNGQPIAYDEAQDIFRAGMEARDNDIERRYHEILYQVQNKIKDESRHETAVRIIHEAEHRESGPVKVTKE